MSSGKKGNTWHFGMKMHVATDDIIGIVTNAVYGPANEHDISRARELIPSETEQVYGDAGYVGMGKREEFQTDKEAEKRSYRINLRPGVLKGRSAEDLIRKIEHFKSSVRCKVEHVFARVKLQMSYRKTRYRGIAKNAHRINTMLALCNLFTFDCYLKRLTPNCAYIVEISTKNSINCQFLDCKQPNLCVWSGFSGCSHKNWHLLRPSFIYPTDGSLAWAVSLRFSSFPG